MSTQKHLVVTNRESGKVIAVETFYDSHGSDPLKNPQLFNRLQLAEDIIDLLPEDKVIGKLSSHCFPSRIIVELKDKKPTKGWKWLKAQPVGTRRTNSGGAKFIITEEGLLWVRSFDHVWYWDGTRSWNNNNLNWHDVTWVKEASEETCPIWEEEPTGLKWLLTKPVGYKFEIGRNRFSVIDGGIYSYVTGLIYSWKTLEKDWTHFLGCLNEKDCKTWEEELTGTDFLKSLKDGTQFRTGIKHYLVTKTRKGVTYDDGLTYTWNELDNVPTNHWIKKLSAKTLTVREPTI